MKSAVAVATCLLLTGCATVVSSPRQKLTFRSLPQGAEVTVNGVAYGRTPLTAEVPRAKNNAVVLRAPGYEDDRFTIATGWNPMMLGNIIFFPWTPFFSTTDRANGANIRYEENRFYSVLDPVGTENTLTRAQARRQRLVRFVAVNDASLSRDLANGAGEYLDAVWQITATPEESRVEGLKTLRTLRSRHPAPPDFAEAAGKALVKD
jgi:hypothetical protein